MKTYEDFLNEKLYSEKFNLHAYFVSKNNQIFIVQDKSDKVILFKMLFHPDYYDILLIAALQLLETTTMTSYI